MPGWEPSDHVALLSYLSRRLHFTVDIILLPRVPDLQDPRAGVVCTCVEASESVSVTSVSIRTVKVCVCVTYESGGARGRPGRFYLLYVKPEQQVGLYKHSSHTPCHIFRMPVPSPHLGPKCSTVRLCQRVSLTD